MQATRYARSSALLALGTILWLMANVAQAHAKLVRADPAPNATVIAPTQIRLLFSEAIAKQYSSFKLAHFRGSAVGLQAVDSRDPQSMAAAPAGPLKRGVYTVTWTAVSSDDGHKTAGHYTFTVR